MTYWAFSQTEFQTTIWAPATRLPPLFSVCECKQCKAKVGWAPPAAFRVFLARWQCFAFLFLFIHMLFLRDFVQLGNFLS